MRRRQQYDLHQPGRQVAWEIRWGERRLVDQPMRKMRDLWLGPHGLGKEVGKLRAICPPACSLIEDEGDNRA
jgi:hypothetical protein